MQNQFSGIAKNKASFVINGISLYCSADMEPTVVKVYMNIHPGMQVMVEEMATSELLDVNEHGQFNFCLFAFG